MKTDMVLGVDIGFGSTKVCYKDENGALKFNKFTSAVAEVEVKSYIQDANAFQFEGKHFYLFEDALRLKEGSCMDLQDYKALRYASPIILRKIMMSLGISTPKKLILGLSIAMIEYSKDYKNYVAKTLNLNEDLIQLVPQGIGSKVAYDSYGIDPNTPNSESKSMNYLGVDIGFNTVDVFQVINGSASATGTAGFEGLGVMAAAKKLQELVGKDIPIDLQECKTILVTGNQVIRGQTIDRSDLVSEILIDYLKGVISEVENKYSDTMNKMDNIIISGGGGALLTKYQSQLEEELSKVYPNNFLKVAKVSEYFNVIGYYLIGA